MTAVIKKTLGHCSDDDFILEFSFVWYVAVQKKRFKKEDPKRRRSKRKIQFLRISARERTTMPNEISRFVAALDAEMSGQKQTRAISGLFRFGSIFSLALRF